MSEMTKNAAGELEQAIVDRLRVSNSEVSADTYENGVAAGKRWAAVDATAKQLRLLDNFRRGYREAWDDAGTEDSNSAYGLGESMYFAIDPESDGHRKSARDFWEAETDGREWVMNAFAKGFTDGALAVWAEAKARF